MTEQQEKWYERETAAFRAWWEAGGEKTYSETPTMAAGAGWLKRAEAASSEKTAMRCPVEAHTEDRCMSVPSAKKEMPEFVADLLEALTTYEQADEQGVYCKVSRQAVDEAVALIEARYSHG